MVEVKGYGGELPQSDSLEIAKVHTIAHMTDLDMLNDIKTSMVESAKVDSHFMIGEKVS